MPPGEVRRGREEDLAQAAGPTGDLLSDELSASSAEDGSLLIQLDDTTLGKDGKIDLAKVIEMFGGAMAKKARETAAGTNEAGTNEAGAAEVGDDADAVLLSAAAACAFACCVAAHWPKRAPA